MFLFTISLPRFVMRQYVALRLHIHDVDIVVCQIDNSRPQATRINDHRGG